MHALISRKLTAILFLMAFGALMGHGMVPHHHHADILCQEGKSHDPAGEGDHHEHPPAAHCHAFNNLDLQDHSTHPVVTVRSLDLFHAAPAVTGNDLRSPETPTRFRSHRIQAADAGCPETSGLRGPPVMG